MDLSKCKTYTEKEKTYLRKNCDFAVLIYFDCLEKIDEEQAIAYEIAKRAIARKIFYTNIVSYLGELRGIRLNGHYHNSVSFNLLMKELNLDFVF